MDIAAMIVATKALGDVFDERIRQDEKWGEQNHPVDAWMCILMEEVGELATEVYHDHFGVKEDGENVGQSEKRMREEAIQVAAVAVAFVECLDRNRGTGSLTKE